jgi:glutathione S-transferase
MTAALKIWGRISSLNVRKVVWTAQALGLPFERVDAGLRYGVVKTPEYLQKNPNALVPLLQDNDFDLWESNVIVRYLCAKYSPGQMYPLDLQQRFDAERWMDWQQTTFNPAGGPAFMQWFRTPPEQRNLDVIAISVAATEPLLAMLNTHLAQRAFMLGNTLTMADIPIASEIHRWWELPQPRPDYPHIVRWYSQILAHPASKGVYDFPLQPSMYL